MDRTIGVDERVVEPEERDSGSHHAAVEVRGLAVDYGQGPVLFELSLDVAEGEILGLLGPSGCGKTTLLRSIAGFVHPQAGTISLGGRIVTGAGRWVPPERRNVGLVPQEGALFPHLDVGANVAFGLVGMSRADRARRVAECLDLVGLPGTERRRPRELSGGQQQRIALARALAPGPSVVLLDEPFSALDATLRTQVREEVRTALRRAGATAVLVTHDQEEALSFSERVAVLREGRVAQVADPATLYRHPVDVHVGEFVGESVRLHGRVEGARVQTELGPAEYHVPSAGAGSGWSPAQGAPVMVLLRPEQVRLDPDLARGGRPAVVRSVTFYGHDALLQMALEPMGTTVLCRTNAEELPEVDDLVQLSIVGDVAIFPIEQG